MERVFKHGLSFRLILGISIIIVLGFGIFGIVSYSSASASLSGQIESSLLSQAKDKAELVNVQLESTFSSVEGVALKSLVKSMDWNRQKPALTEEAKRLGFIRMGVADLKGDAMYSNGNTEDISSHDYFKAAASGKTIISDPMANTSGSTMVLEIATPIRNGAGNTVGVLTATSDGAFLRRLAEGFTAGESGYAFIINKDGDTIAHPDQEPVMPADNGQANAKGGTALTGLSAIKEKMMAGGTGSDRYMHDGTSYLIGYASLGATGWSVALTVREDEALAGAKALTLTLIITAVLFALSAGLFALLYYRLAVKPIRGLTTVSEALAAGNTDAGICVPATKESGRLCEAVKNVQDSVRRLTQDASILREAAMQGSLHARADLSLYRGDYQRVMACMNGVFEGIAPPFNEFKALLDRYCVNDFTDTVQGDYRGDIKGMADSVNTMRGRWLAVQGTYVAMSKGDFSQLPKLQAIGKRSANDEFLPPAIRMMQTINEVIDEANRLSGEVARGNLEVRGDSTRFEGRYKEIIEGINSIMEAMARPIDEAVSVLHALAKNDFTVEMSGEYQGSFKDLSLSVNKVQTTLNDVMMEISIAAGQVATGTRHVSDGSQQLSQGATEQASALEELTASIHQVAVQTRENAGNAEQAGKVAVQAKDYAVTGNRHMLELLQSMQDINASSANISKIIKVIDDLAFQSNILALNAAVEAARAGVHGKSFAVVAEEVRSLAMKSAESAKETAALIDNSTAKVEEGTRIARDTAEALNEIVSSVEKAAELVDEITVASQEHAAAIDQINQAVDQVSMVVQSNSATAVESAAASEELSSQADRLKEMVGQFKLSGDGDIGVPCIEKPVLNIKKAASKY